MQEVVPGGLKPARYKFTSNCTVVAPALIGRVKFLHCDERRSDGRRFVRGGPVPVIGSPSCFKPNHELDSEPMAGSPLPQYIICNSRVKDNNNETFTLYITQGEVHHVQSSHR
jgi:hypothetical protein